MSQEEDVARARKAASLLDDPVMKKAFEDIEKHYSTLWSNSGPSQYELREECHVMLYGLRQFRRQLQSYIETGKLLAVASSEIN